MRRWQTTKWNREREGKLRVAMSTITGDGGGDEAALGDMVVSAEWGTWRRRDPRGFLATPWARERACDAKEWAR